LSDPDLARGINDPSHPQSARLSDVRLRVRALESLLLEKGLVDHPAAPDELVGTWETPVGPHNGARVVARGWTDQTSSGECSRTQPARMANWASSASKAEMIVLENTPTDHNIIVCTLFSCYPWPALRLPPVWYKSSTSRGVLREFAVHLPEHVQVRV
jgi:nitrile hydratase